MNYNMILFQKHKIVNLTLLGQLFSLSKKALLYLQNSQVFLRFFFVEKVVLLRKT